MESYLGTASETAVRMASLTPLPGGSVDWQSIRSLWPETRALARCQQDPVHHAEGDVDVHTRMVLEAIVSSRGWREAPPARRALLFWAAVFHDIGKPSTTAVDEGGRISAPGHSRVGAAMARFIMWQAGLPVPVREEICSIVAAHQVPFWLYERPDSMRAACRLSLALSPRELALHAEADAIGRHCADRQDMLDRVALSLAVFEEAGALDAPFPFANDESRVAYFEKDDRNPWYEAHEEHRCTVTLVCGLPGSGKDTWIAANMRDIPSVSLDSVREELGVSPLDNQGRVIQEGFERAREHLRASRDFCWNATNVTRLNRERVAKLARDYGARVRIVYLETCPNTLFVQNASRKAAVPVDAILRLARKLEPPQPWEAHEVRWISDGIDAPLPRVGGEIPVEEFNRGR